MDFAGETAYSFFPLVAVPVSMIRSSSRRARIAVRTGRSDFFTCWHTVFWVTPALPSMALVLVCPPVHVATGPAYGALAERRASAGLGAYTHLERVPSDWDTVSEIAANDFEPGVADAHPEVRRALDALRDTGLRFVMLSGSGGACFGLASGTAEASSTAQRLSDELGWRVVATRTLEEVPSVSPL